MLSDRCGGLIARMGNSWSVIGWGIFGLLFVGPFLLYGLLSAAGILAAMLALWGLLAIWWVMDGIDQQLSAGQWIAGVVLLVISRLPMGGLIFRVLWVLYWTRVRE